MIRSSAPRAAVLRAAALVLALAVSGSAPASAAVIRVPTQVSSFRLAVQNAAPGDTVQLVGNGGATYVNSDVRLDKDLTIQGGWRVDFALRDADTYVSVIRDTATLPSLPLLRVVGSPHIVFDGVWIWGGKVGVLAESGPTLEFRDCVIRGQRSIGSTGDEDANRGGGLRLVGGSATFDGCRIESINIAYSGAAIAAISAGAVILRNTTVSNCVSTRIFGEAPGGAIFARSVANLRFEGCTVADCATVQSGGLGWVEGSTLTAVDTQFLRGIAADDGGAFVLSSGSSATFDRCRIRDNRGIQGGALQARPGCHVTLRDCTLSGNAGTAEGGALRVESGSLVAERCQFSTNNAAGFPAYDVATRGGAVFLSATDATVTDCSFTDELAVSKGGAWFQIGGQVVMTGTRFTGCESGVFGGAIGIEVGGSILLDRVLLEGNTAKLGGALSASFTGSMTARHVTITGGTGHSAGAAVYVDTGGTVDLFDSIACCAQQGDLISCSGGAVRTTNCDIWNDDSVNPRNEWGGSCPDPTGQNGNLKVPPGFCPSDPDFRVATGSPCSGTASDGGDLGWKDGGCPAAAGPLGIEPISWGRLKAAWRDR